jgi:hypothetical protein
MVKEQPNHCRYAGGIAYALYFCAESDSAIYRGTMISSKR